MLNEESITEKKDNRRKVINVALIVFAISIVVFTVIGALVIDNFSHLQQVEELSSLEDETYKGHIDERLHFIALQDQAQAELNQTKEGTENTETQQTEEGVIEEPEEITLFLGQEEEVKRNVFTDYNERYRKKDPSEVGYNAQTPDTSELTNIPFKKEVESPSALNMKVVIGNYATREEAEAELVKISSHFSATPFLKVVNGNYAIQVGSFRTPATAYEFVNSLRAQGFSARIIEE